MMPKKRVLLVDTHAILVDGLRRILAPSLEFEVVAKARDGLEALRQCEIHAPDLVMLGLDLPKKDGTEVLREIKREWPMVKVLVLTMHCNLKFLRKAIEAGTDGYCLKNIGGDELLHAMHLVCEGKKYLSRQLYFNLPSFTGWMADRSEDKPFSGFLSRRENEILRLVVQGFTYSQISTALLISKGTVDNHCSNIRKKLGVRSRQAMTVWAFRSGLLPDGRKSAIPRPG
jgi:DNA-binding NarL/FixJ family response regulator